MLARLKLSALVLFLSATTALAVPNTMNYQGQLFLNGTPTTGPVTIIFRMYPVATGGTELWNETDNVTVTNGLFQTVLGDGTVFPAALFSDQVPWLEMEVNGTVLTPRTQLHSVPYALNAPAAGSNELWSTDGTNVWRVSGNVSIGTNGTEAPLTVYGQLQNPANAVVLRNTLPGGGAMTFAIGASGANVPSGIYGIGDETDTRIAINRTNGWVGIGTTAPRDKLEVEGGVASDYHNTLGEALGNGSVYSHLDDSHLEFHGTYGYGVGDEYIEFQSDFNPSVGGQGTLARITANRNPDGYDLGRGRLKMSVRSGSTLNDMLVVDYQGVSIAGNLNVVGTKCRVVTTPSGELKMNAVESAHALFMDDEPSARLINGRCRVNLSPKFLSTVTVNGKYPLTVSVTFYGPHGGGWYVQRDDTGFTVIDPSGCNAEFSWDVKARQKGYEDTNLDPVTQTAAK